MEHWTGIQPTLTDNYNFACVWLRGNGAREGIPGRGSRTGRGAAHRLEGCEETGEPVKLVFGLYCILAFLM